MARIRQLTFTLWAAIVLVWAGLAICEVFYG